MYNFSLVTFIIEFFNTTPIMYKIQERIWPIGNPTPYFSTLLLAQTTFWNTQNQVHKAKFVVEAAILILYPLLFYMQIILLNMNIHHDSLHVHSVSPLAIIPLIPSHRLTNSHLIPLHFPEVTPIRSLFLKIYWEMLFYTSMNMTRRYLQMISLL